MKKLFLSFLVTILLPAFQGMNAQSFWVINKGTYYDDRGNSIAVDALGNSYITGYYDSQIFIGKFSSEGSQLWIRTIGSGYPSYGSDIALDHFGNIYITGSFGGNNPVDFDPGGGVYNITPTGLTDWFVAKFNSAGSFIWAKQWSDVSIARVAIDSYGNPYIAGLFEDPTDFDTGPGTSILTPVGSEAVFITKLDTSGNLVWVKQFGDITSGFGSDIEIAIDGSNNVCVAGQFRQQVDFNPGSAVYRLTATGVYNDIFILKLDASGGFVWAGQFAGSNDEPLSSMVIDVNDNIYISGGFEDVVDFNPGGAVFNLVSVGNNDVFIAKLDASGNFLQAVRFGGTRYDLSSSLAVDAGENIYVVGEFKDTVDFDPGLTIHNLFSPYLSGEFYIVHMDRNFNLISARQSLGEGTFYSSSIGIDSFQRVYVTGYFSGDVDFDISIDTFNLYSRNEEVFLLKLPMTKPFVVQGRIVEDLNSNCSIDTSDMALPGVIIRAEPAPSYGVSNEFGEYTLYIFDTGNYTISVATQDLLRNHSCTTSYDIQLFGIPDTTHGIDFKSEVAFFCPRLSVDFSTPLLRRCFGNNYTFRYINTGTLPASNAYIEVDFGDYLQPQTSTLPWSTVSGNVYTFPIGNLNINQQGSFNVTALLDCAADLGSTQCVTAHIYPDSLCLPTPAGWDKSETAVSGTCVNDSLVCFTIKNRSAAGSGDMAGTAQWRLYVNDTLITQGTYQLAGQDSLVKCFPANGKTYRLEADQNLPHPRRSKPQAIVEACGSPTAFGFVNTVRQDDEELAVETFCMTVIGSFDPNDKQVSPVGITSNNYITADDELEYLIRFQNTGTDTAFKVVIRDTIATDVLDIATLTSGASSHDYTFNIYGQGIAEWTFDNILLPDSFINEPASHGFVQFKIKQLPGNADGTLIENRAAIYFDFNAPVITNTAWNEVNEAEMPKSLFSSIAHIGCPDTSSGSISIAVSGGLLPYTYQWSTGDTVTTLLNLLPGVYSVTVTDAIENIYVDTIAIGTPLSYFISTQSSVTCFGGNDAAAKANPTGGVPPYTAQWSDGQTGFTANNLSAGNYQVTVADSNGCELITSITIQDGYQINSGAIAGADSADINQTATYSVNAGFAYTWSVTNGTIISGQGANSVEVDWNAIGQGTLEVAVADSGCTQTVSKTIALVDPTGVENDLLDAIELYPNPTNGTITLKANIQTIASLKLYDSIGKQVLEQTAMPLELQQGIVFDLKEINEGIYFLSIRTAEGTGVMKVIRY